MIIGLTGNIACGKSLVSQYLQQKQIPIIDADIIARKVVEPGTRGLNRLVEIFGEDILLENGQLNRQRLGQIVFTLPEKRAKMDEVLAPLIFAEIQQELKNYANHPLVILDIPLLFEQPEYLEVVDEVWLVIAEKEQQVERLGKRNGYQPKEAYDRIMAQIPQKEKVPFAQVIIDNRGSEEETFAQVEKLLEQYER